MNIDPNHRLILIASSGTGDATRYGLAVEIDGDWTYLDGWDGSVPAINGCFSDVSDAASRWEAIIDAMGKTHEIVRRHIGAREFAYVPHDLVRDLAGKRLGREAALSIVSDISSRAHSLHLCAWIKLLGLTGERPVRHAGLAALYGCSASGVGTWTRRISRWLDIAERRWITKKDPDVFERDHLLDASLRRAARPLSADILSSSDWITILSKAERNSVIEAAETRIKEHGRTVVRPATDLFKTELSAMIESAVAEALEAGETVPLGSVIGLIRTRKYIE